MAPVQLIMHEGILVLRARNSELVILAEHVSNLQKLTNIEAFSQYFLQEALLNRPARKLFQAWLRKDLSLWKRIFAEIAPKPEKNKKTKQSPNS